MGILDTLKKLFGGDEAPAKAPTEEAQTESAPAEETPAEGVGTQEEQPRQ
ncbi:MAG: hypothetical protein U9Q85_00745 [Patescibacteria group bacterium]|nr:hypothetical protein [Patescibacteria group bacterium]